MFLSISRIDFQYLNRQICCFHFVMTKIAETLQIFSNFFAFLIREFLALALSEGIIIFDGREVVGQNFFVEIDIFFVKM